MANPTINYLTNVITVPQSYLTLLSGVNYSLDTAAFKISLRDLEDDVAGIAAPKILNHNTTVLLGGIEYARIIEILSPYTITFEDVGTPYAVTLIGSNNNILDVTNLNNVAVRSNNSAGLVQMAEIQHSSFNGVVTVDVVNGKPGTIYPNGTTRVPVNNLVDALAIAVSRGINIFNIVGTVTIDSGNYAYGYTFKGSSPVTSQIIIADLANINNCEFHDTYVTGVLDDSNVFRRCIVGAVTSYDGFMDKCAISGPITLGGTSTTTLIDCFTFEQLGAVPIVNIGTGSQLNLTRYSGEISLANKTGTEFVDVDMASGVVILESTIVNGIINLRGIGRVEDNSSGAATINNELLNGIKLYNIHHLVESLRPHHIGSGNVWYWDPHNGDDLNTGDTPVKALKTFAQAQLLAVDNNHDVIFCLSGNPAGTTITTENIIITKNHLMVRGPGRSFEIKSADDNQDAIHISGNGVQISGMHVSTSATNTQNAIHSVGNFTHLKDLWVSASVNGVHFQNGEYGIADNVKMHHNLGYGLKFSGTCDHVDIIDCHIGSNYLDNVIVDIDPSTHEVNLLGSTVIHSSVTGYGINISANTKSVIIHDTVSIMNNFAGDINDLSTNTYNARATSISDIVDNVWLKTLDGLPAADIIRLMSSALMGKVSGAGTGTEIFRDMGDTKNRLTVTTDTNGNRLTVVRDGT